MFIKGRQLKRNNEQMKVIQNDLIESTSDKTKLNEKHVSLYLFIEKNKSDPTETLTDEFQNKIIIYGYVMVSDNLIEGFFLINKV